MRRVQVHPVPWSLSLDSDLIMWKQLDVTFLSYDPYYARMAAHVISPTERLEIILSHQSLLVRATDLTKYLSKCPPEALKCNFRIIVNSIFCNFEREQSWDLRCMRKLDYPQESAAILKLLAADGPLITLALRLMDDHNFLLEFPLEGLPLHLHRRLLDGADVPTFFANKLGPLHGFRKPTGTQSLLLNPFEYFVFCFASVNLLGMKTGRSADYLNGWAALQDTLYTNVLDEYLSHYFPCNGSGVPSHNFNYNVNQAKEAVFMANSLLRHQQQPKHNYGMSQQSSSHQESSFPTLFKPSVLKEQAGAVSPRENLFLTTHPSAYKEVWRSETFLHVFMELWMCGYHGALDTADNLVLSGPMTFGGLPSVEVVKSIRMLVRHLHYFINCVNSRAMHPMDEIRRTTFPIFQGRLYTFLRYLFHHWPLDNSFRIVYETWLSYIQPWRYVTPKNLSSRENCEVPLDRRWFNFIIDNILFYSKILSQMILRLERVDLTATKNALMFYRLAKVFTAQDNLKLMLHEIESSIQSYETQLSATTTDTSHTSNTKQFTFRKANQSLLASTRPVTYSTPGAGRGSATVGGYFGGGSVSPIASSPGTSATIQDNIPSITTVNAAKIVHLKQLMKDFENAYYVYEPIFSSENVQKIQVLLATAAEARDSLLFANEKFTENSKQPKPLAGISNFFNSLWSESTSEKEIAANGTEKNKAANQLEFTRNQFAMFFDISLDENNKSPMTNGAGASLSQSENSFFISSDSISRSNGAFAKSQNKNIGTSGQKPKTILPPGIVVDADAIPHGNPDEAHFRSDESHLLGRALSSLSSFLNYVFEDNIDQIYFSSSLLGRYIRAMLAEPAEYIVCERQGPAGARRLSKIARYLPPRLHLRVCASYTFFAWIFAILVFSMLFNLGFGATCLSLLTLYFIYLTFRAASEPINKLEELRQLKGLYIPPVDNDYDYINPPIAESSPFAPLPPLEDELHIRRRNVRFDGSGDAN